MIASHTVAVNFGSTRGCKNEQLVCATLRALIAVDNALQVAIALNDGLLCHFFAVLVAHMILQSSCIGVYRLNTMSIVLVRFISDHSN